MQLRLKSVLAIPCLLGSLLLLPGGCPLQSGVLAAQVTAPAPGVYYVEQREQGLFALELSGARADGTDWVKLESAAASWFAADGFYELADSGAWNVDESRIDVSYDEALQLYDAAPAVPVSASGAN